MANPPRVHSLFAKTRGTWGRYGAMLCSLTVPLHFSMRHFSSGRSGEWMILMLRSSTI